ncbi:MAG TPA: hypothetical protein VH415_07520 [Nitrososphaeraceae archaeon]|jgi:hypothetical protein
MVKYTRLIPVGTALILSAIFIANIGTQGFAQQTAVDIEKLKQILNATRTAIDANDIPGALTQLDLADGQLGGGGNRTGSTNMTNTSMVG